MKFDMAVLPDNVNKIHEDSSVLGLSFAVSKILVKGTMDCQLLQSTIICSEVVVARN